MTELPVNCIFDKGITGCGGTELALRNDKDTIIAMPYIALIQNKVSQKQHVDKVLGVYGNTTNAEIEEYLLSHPVKKIAVTYDSLPRIISILERMGVDVYNQFFLLVDEWHVLFNSYAFRNAAIKGLLEVAPSFKEVTYMTATPIEKRYMFEQFKHLPVVEVI